MSLNLHAALAERSKIDKRVSDILKTEYGPGARVLWKRFGAVHEGRVVKNGYGDRLMVRNQTTGTEYWIHAFDIQC